MRWLDGITQLKRQESEQTQRDSEGGGAWCAAVQQGHKERTDRLLNNNNN